ncbi:MAG: NAD+ kinase [Flavobacteriales bacterium]|jgi:NAD+ kinase
MTIGVYGRQFDTRFAKPIELFLSSLSANGFDLRIHGDFVQFLSQTINLDSSLPTFESFEDVENMSFVISIGGDGTILNTVTFIKDSGVPILGINAGRLGFLSNVSLDAIELTIQCLLKREYTIDKRSLIHVEGITEEDHCPFALNEVTVHKKDTSNMITVKAWVDGVYMNSYWADGLIISTPTGSTAYSLSCGGPIVMPGSDNVILTPIAPHNLNVRPVVIPSESVVQLEAQTRDQEILLTLDSRSYSLPNGSKIILRKADFQINLISLPNQDFFSTIRSKMMWGIDKRN